jgi:hypothetical protein
VRGGRSGTLLLITGPTDGDALEDFEKNDKLPPNYRTFNAFVYSLDSFLPIINLGLKELWMPGPQLKSRAITSRKTWSGDHVACLTKLPFPKTGKFLLLVSLVSRNCRVGADHVVRCRIHRDRPSLMPWQVRKPSTRVSDSRG